MELPSWLKIENLIGKLDISSWFKRENSPVDKRHIETTVNIANLEQHKTTIIIADPNSIPDLLGEGTHSIEQLRQPISLLPSSISDAIVSEAAEEDKKAINKRIDEAVALLNLNRLDEAKNTLLTILGEIKNKQALIKEQTRVYNNLGVVYN